MTKCAVLMLLPESYKRQTAALWTYNHVRRSVFSQADHAKEAGSAFAAHSKDKDAFYVKKSRKKREYMKLLEEKRAQAKRQQQEMLDEKIAKAEQERSRLAKAWSSKQQMAKASRAYESNIMTETVEGGEVK